MMALAQFLRRDLNPMLAAVLCAVVLVGTLAYMIEGRAAILRNGAEVVLKAAPIDPRDLMRGDYVRLGYEDISTVSGALMADDWPEQDVHAPLWLALATGEEGLAKVTSISFTRPDSGAADTVYLKSEPVTVYADDKDRAMKVMLSLQFGIERYYVPEGEGLEIEDARNEGRTTVALRISASGVPQIARLMIDGETLYSEPLY